MSLVRWDRPHFKADEPCAAQERHTKRKDAKQRLDDAYADVDARDHGVCWVTGRMTVKGAADPRNRRERHHLRGRRVKPEWKYRPARIITLTAEAHDLITTGKIEVEGDDARKPIFFHWHASVKPKYRPFEILPSRLVKQQRAEAVEGSED